MEGSATPEQRRAWYEEYLDELVVPSWAEKMRTFTFRYAQEKDLLDKKTDPAAKRRKRRENGGDVRMTCLVNARLCFPESEWPALHERMSRDIKAGCPQLCLNEIVLADEEGCSRVRAYFELDYCGPSPVDRRVVLEHARIVNHTVRRYLPQEFCRMVMMVNNTRPKVVEASGTADREDEIHYKDGVHLIFPDAVVTVDQLRQILHSCQIAMPEEYADTIDESVLKASGSCNLRPPGSYKADTCYACKADQKVARKRGKKAAADAAPQRNDCERCGGAGKLIDPWSAYAVDMVWGADGKRDLAQKAIMEGDALQMITTCSIIPEPDQDPAPYERPQGEPAYVPAHLRSSRKGDGASRRFAYKGDGTQYCSKWKDIFEDEGKVHAIVLQVIEAMEVEGEYPYKGTLIDRVQINGRGDTLRVHLKGRGRTFCRNVRREHTSNRVYFDFSWKHKHCYFKCYAAGCKDEMEENAARRQNLSTSLTRKELEKLFPDKVEQKTVLPASVARYNAIMGATDKKKKAAGGPARPRAEEINESDSLRQRKRRAEEAFRRNTAAIANIGKPPPAKDDRRGGGGKRRR